MTREEAIEELKRDIHNAKVTHHLSEHYEIAIQALEQIAILKEAYNKGYKDGQEALTYHLELCKDEGSIIEIPEGVSNMELMQAVFHIDFTELRTKAEWMEWWNAPYRKEQE